MTLEVNDSAVEQILYMALELGDKRWRVVFSDGSKRRHITIAAGAIEELVEAMAKAKSRFRLPASVRVVSCYEAGRDGFWLHRYLEHMGVENRVVDASSIEVPRRKRRVKTDRVDAEKLLELLVRALGGERGVFSVVRVPSVAAEDARRLHRERERLKKERTAHRNRLGALLVTQGIRLKPSGDFVERLARVRLWDGRALPVDLRAELEREYARWRLVEEQLRAVEAEQARRVREGADPALAQVGQLIALKGLDRTSAWVFVMEFFGWRRFRNRREVGALAGLVGMPYQSGERSREQGIGKAGNRRVRAMLIQIAWGWLRFQPQSALSQWYARRFAGGGARMRRIGIVALARRLLVALWRYLEYGVVPEGALFKTAA